MNGNLKLKKFLQYLSCTETSRRLADTNNIVANLKKELNGIIYNFKIFCYKLCIAKNTLVFPETRASLTNGSTGIFSLFLENANGEELIPFS